ncbi:hypothetical protein D3C78_1447950 [compost metagenome]
MAQTIRYGLRGLHTAHQRFEHAVGGRRVEPVGSIAHQKITSTGDGRGDAPGYIGAAYPPYGWQCLQGLGKPRRSPVVLERQVRPVQQLRLDLGDPGPSVRIGQQVRGCCIGCAVTLQIAVTRHQRR